MDYQTDQRIVLTLDAGGTNFVFSAVQGKNEVVRPVCLPAHAQDLEQSLNSMVQGFGAVKEQLDQAPVAISFAFPGPADYPNGIIDNMGNLPAYKGGVALGGFLEEAFGVPVFINNDGDLFVYGEAIGGLLPKVNQMLATAGSPKRFRNLFGITLGTGFGAGIVTDGQLYMGDNSAAGEIWITRNKRRPRCFAEEGVSIRAVQGSYAEVAGIDAASAPSPKDIFEIGMGQKEGNQAAACQAFAEMGEVIGDALANAITLMDGLIVIGGGLAAAYPLFIDAVLAEMNGTIESYRGEKLPRIVQRCFDLESPAQRLQFLEGNVKQIKVPGTEKNIPYDSLKRLGIGHAVLDTSRAVAIGAYVFALNQLDT
ncbi:MAG: ROK family protein [Pirellulales bacterium]|nr:ROK family protein [Pirellulales bacterium]